MISRSNVGGSCRFSDCENSIPITHILFAIFANSSPPKSHINSNVDQYLAWSLQLTFSNMSPQNQQLWFQNLPIIWGPFSHPNPGETPGSPSGATQTLHQAPHLGLRLRRLELFGWLGPWWTMDPSPTCSMALWFLEIGGSIWGKDMSHESSKNGLALEWICP
jgi:hypothetical protein